MKIVPKVQSWELMDYIRGKGDCLRDYESAGLHRGWDDILIGRLDKLIDRKRERLEEQILRATKTRKVAKPAA